MDKTQSIPHQQIITTSPSHAKITWIVSAEEVGSRLKAAEKEVIKQLESDPTDKFKKKHKRKKVNRISELRGFRPNKYPRNLLWRKHSKEIQEKVLIPLLRELWEEMMQDKPFRPVSQPQASSKYGPQHGVPLEVTVDVDIWPSPKIDPSRYAKLYFQVPAKGIVHDVQVDQEIENRRRYYARYVVAEETQEIQMGDCLIIRIAEKHPGDEDFRPEQSIYIVLGGGGLIPALEQALFGRHKGEEIIASISNNGGLVDIRIRIDDHKVGILPTDEELCEKEGVSDILSLRKKILDTLQEQVDLYHRNALRRSIMNQVIGNDLFSIPQSMAMERAHILEQEAWITAMKKGNQYTPSEESRKQLVQLADAMLREEAVLRAIAENEGIDISGGEVEGEIERIANRDGQDISEVKAWVEREKIDERISNQLLCNKALDFLIAKTKVSEIVQV